MRRTPLFAVASVLLFLACWGAVHYWFYRYDLIGDVGIYHGYATQMRHGAVPYRDFAFEYPPGALPVLLLPVYLGGYAHAFGVLMGILGAALVWVVAGAASRSRTLAVAVSPLFVGSLVLNRFDLWPTLLATTGLVLLLRDRHRLGWAILGAAVAAKLWPVVLLPLAAVWTLRRRGRSQLERSVAACVAVLVVAFGPFLVLAPHGLWESVWSQVSRPMEIESLGASILMVGHRSGVAMSHGGYDASGVLVKPLEVISTLVEIAALAAVWVAFAKRAVTDERFIRYAAAAVCAFVAFGKVLSPQYLIWLVPLVALVRGRRGWQAIALLGAALVLTQVWFPSRFYPYAYHYHLAWVVLLRNLVLVALCARLALDQVGSVRLSRSRG